MTMTIKKGRSGIRFPATRLAITAGSVVAFLGIWVHVARSGQGFAADPAPIATLPALQFATGTVAVDVPAAGGQEPESAPSAALPMRSISRGS
jgi:hypothetical protein